MRPSSRVTSRGDEPPVDRLEAVAAEFARQVGLVDAITGQPNLPGFKKAMQESASERCSLVCVAVDQIMALDADRGNALLRQIASILKSNIRDNDVPARTGVEEFAMFLPGTTLDGAVVVADRVRTAVNEADFDLGQDLALTCSLGIASIPDTVSAIDELMGAASGAREEARESGPNQIATMRVVGATRR